MASSKDVNENQTGSLLFARRMARSNGLTKDRIRVFKAISARFLFIWQIQYYSQVIPGDSIVEGSQIIAIKSRGLHALQNESINSMFAGMTVATYQRSVVIGDYWRLFCQVISIISLITPDGDSPHCGVPDRAVHSPAL